MNTIRRTLAPLAVAFAAFALVPSVAHAQGMTEKGAKQDKKAHDTWIEKAGTAIFHFLGLDSLTGIDTQSGQQSAESRAAVSR